MHCATCTKSRVFREKCLCKLPIDKRPKKWYNGVLGQIPGVSPADARLNKMPKTSAQGEGFRERRYIGEIGRVVRRHCPKPLFHFYYIILFDFCQAFFEIFFVGAGGGFYTASTSLSMYSIKSVSIGLTAAPSDQPLRTFALSSKRIAVSPSARYRRTQFAFVVPYFTPWNLS